MSLDLEDFFVSSDFRVGSAAALVIHGSARAIETAGAILTDASRPATGWWHEASCVVSASAEPQMRQTSFRSPSCEGYSMIRFASQLIRPFGNAGFAKSGRSHAAENRTPISWNWEAEGFQHPPQRICAPAGIRLFRCWDGTVSSMRGNPSRAGVCFSSDKPASRLEAEKLFAVFEWGNRCRNLSEFLVPAGTPMWVGNVDPGDSRAAFGRFYGKQVFIENPAAQKLTVVSTLTLKNDLNGAWVLPGKTVDALIATIQREFPDAKIRITGRGRTVLRQAELMVQRRRQNRQQFLSTYRPAPHITEMDQWVSNHPQATEAQAVAAFVDIINRARRNGATVSNHLSDTARDISIPAGGPAVQAQILQRIKQLGGRVLDERDAVGGAHWHVDLLTN